MHTINSEYIRKDNTFFGGGLSLLYGRSRLLLCFCISIVLWSRAFGVTKVFIKQSISNKTISVVFTKDYKTGKTIKVGGIKDVYSGHYHPAEFYGGYLYIIRRIPGGNEAYKRSDKWTDELWRYDKNGKGIKLLASRGLDFRVSMDGKLIAVLTALNNNFGKDNLHIINPNGKPIKTFKSNVLGSSGSLDFERWAGRYLWLKDQEETDIYGFTRIDTRKMSVQKYKFSLEDEDYDLDTASLQLAYSDYPPMFDTEGYNDFIKKKTPVHLYVYNLVSKKKHLIARCTAKRFDPKWKSASTLYYNNPKGKGRLSKHIRD